MVPSSYGITKLSSSVLACGVQPAASQRLKFNVSGSEMSAAVRRDRNAVDSGQTHWRTRSILSCCTLYVREDLHQNSLSCLTATLTQWQFIHAPNKVLCSCRRRIYFLSCFLLPLLLHFFFSCSPAHRLDRNTSMLLITWPSHELLRRPNDTHYCN